MIELVAGVLFFWFFANFCLLVAYHRDLQNLWQEPVFNQPIVIFEGDDWGAGPLEQADALKKLTACLSKFTDKQGRHPVMTLAVTLSVADTQAIAACDANEYHGLDFDDDQFSSIRRAIMAGVEKGVFTLQLHGKEHYWPDALMSSAKKNQAVNDWLIQKKLPYTETLPSHLQSRWVDTSVLPSKPWSSKKIQAAAQAEVSLYQRLFNTLPRIVVPPTFVWTQVVESAWKANGVQAVVTPGCKIMSRDAEGKPVSQGAKLLNGMESEDGLMYVVRDEYFEPSMGHQTHEKLAAIEQKTQQGRPVLFESHRFNYVGEPQTASLLELDKLLFSLLKTYPQVQFISTDSLVEMIKIKTSPLIETNRLKRVAFILNRLKQLPGFWRFAKLTGFAFILNKLCAK